MIGLPDQTYEDLVSDIIFFKENDIDMIGMGPYILHEETPLGQSSVEKILSDEKRFELSLKSIGEEVVYFKQGNSPHFYNRTK